MNEKTPENETLLSLTLGLKETLPRIANKETNSPVSPSLMFLKKLKFHQIGDTGGCQKQWKRNEN